MVQLFAVTEEGPRSLPVPPQAETIYDALTDLPTGVYTALCTFDHDKFLCLEAHLERLEQSFTFLNWDYELDRHLLVRSLRQVCAAFPAENARVRIDILPEVVPSLGTESRLLIALSPFQPPAPELYEQGVRVGLARALQRQQPLVKDAAFVAQRQPYLQGQVGQPTYYEYLLLSGDQHILEGATSNFYALREGVLWTAGEGVLAGIARRVVLQMAEELGIPVRLEAVPLAELNTLDEAFLSSSSRAIIPIVAVDGQQIGNGRPGPLTSQLLAAYRAFVAREIK